MSTYKPFRSDIIIFIGARMDREKHSQTPKGESSLTHIRPHFRPILMRCFKHAKNASETTLDTPK